MGLWVGVLVVWMMLLDRVVSKVLLVVGCVLCVVVVCLVCW